jgi:isoamylase
MDRWVEKEGTHSPLEVTWMEAEQAVNTALYSKQAIGLPLLLYTSDDVVNPAIQHHLNDLINKSWRIWHYRNSASQMRDVAYYAYQVEGQFDPQEGHRFDPEKTLIDSYAKRSSS